MKKSEIHRTDHKLSRPPNNASDLALKPQCTEINKLQSECKTSSGDSRDVTLTPSRTSSKSQTPDANSVVKGNDTNILFEGEEKNEGQSPVLHLLNKASGSDRSPQIIESTPQTSRKRRVSWDSNIGRKLSWKKKKLSLSKKPGKRTFDITISPISGRMDSPSRSPNSVVASPILKHVLRKQHRPGRFSQSQILDPALKNSFGFKVKFQNLQNTKSGREYSYLTTMVMEIFVLTRGDLRPDPEYDEVCCLFYSILNDVPSTSKKPLRTSGCIINQNACNGMNRVLHTLGIEEKCVVANSAQDEVDLFGKFVEVVSFWDPDIVIGYEIEMLSWGYVLQRGKKLELPLHVQLSRLPHARDKKGPEPNASKDKNRERNLDPDWESYAGLQIPGRIVLNLWRLMKDEIPVQSYTYENMAFHILHQRVPAFSHRQLTDWWISGSSKFRYYVFEHFLRRVKGSIDLIEQLNLIGRTSELARLFGIQFFEVFSRGSQWRVESLMLRLAKAANMVSVSPSMEQRARMKAPEWLPLILEPQSRFYVDPVLVLDFQSLYPSVMIAYNYCFSTCLGRLQNLGDPGYVEFGCTYLRIKSEMLKELLEEDMITFSPAGIAFVRQEVREGILPRMLKDILDTRLMVKQSMKIHKDDAILQRVLDSRQLGLKLIANVTYGYTSANFSGRMPAVEVGDSVVSKGRETLERAISLVENTPKWGAKVIYGDTDSLFVQLPGKTREDAFRIGEEIAEAVTLENPKPVKLKFEKVYHPCILQTKKRYVGYKYEKADQQEPVYEAKGIETVRRDGCPATVKILEKSLKILFETKDISLVKDYVQRQFTKILSGSAHLQDFIFAKEFRGRTGYRPGAAVPAMEIAKKQTSVDPRAEPRSGERVPYVIVYGSPGLPLIRLVKTPQEVLMDPSLRLNANYYISKVIIPPLNRCLSLLGADPASWYESMQRPASSLTHHLMTMNNRNGKGLENRIGESSIASFFKSLHCVVCESVSSTAICGDCQSQPDVTITAITARIRSLEAKYAGLLKVCGACAGDPEVGRQCVSLDCPVMYKRKTAESGLNEAKALFEVLEKFSSEVS